MKPFLKALLTGSFLICAAGAQQTPQPALRKGVSVQMPVAGHAVMMRAADEPQAVVLAITANGDLYNGAERTEPGALPTLTAETIYLKADSRAPFQKVLTVLDALQGKSVVLLTASPASAPREAIVPPYGLKVLVPR